MSDILLTHGYCIAEDAHEQQIMKPYPPLGLLYISSYLKEREFDVDLFDMTFASLTEFHSYVKENRPRVVGIYCLMMTKFNVLSMMAMCKEVGATVILGGPEPVNYAREYLAHGADIIVASEGEETLTELLPHLAKHGLTQLGNIQGIIFEQNGAPFRTSPRPLQKDLATRPWPDRAAIPLDRYLQTWKTHHGQSSVSLITARGCPYTCKWCSHSVFGHTHRRRSVEDVANEIEWIKERYNPDLLWFADDVFTIVPRWTLQLRDELKRRGICIPFECISRADRLNEKVIDALAEMGCYRLWIGAESGSQRILEAMDRRTEAADVQQKTKMLQAHGIEVGTFIMLGYDGEQIEDIAATVDHLKAASPDVFLTTVAYPIKGTTYFEAVEENVHVDEAWEKMTDRDYRVFGRFSPRFYSFATRWMVNEVNFHKERGSGNWKRLGKLWLNGKIGRIGMTLTKHEREGQPSGRGWFARERAQKAW